MADHVLMNRILDGLMADNLTVSPDGTNTTQGQMIAQESIEWTVAFEEVCRGQTH